jgi:DNA anti-recombination protein RmuC
MFGSLNILPYVIIASIVFTVGGYFKGRADGKSAIAVEFAQYKEEQAKAHSDALEQAREKEQKLQQSANKIREEKDREIRKINALNSSLVDSLRDRPGRQMPDYPDARQDSCTGNKLYREDAEFLARLAGEADQLMIALKQCYSQYDSLTK